MNVCYPLGAFRNAEVHSYALASVPVFPPRAATSKRNFDFSPIRLRVSLVPTLGCNINCIHITHPLYG